MRQDDEEKEVIYVTIKEACHIFQRSYQSIIWIIKKGKVLSKKIKGGWWIDINSLKIYFANRWKRICLDKKQNEMTLEEASKYLHIPYMVIYHSIENKLLNCRKSDTKRLFVNKEEILKYEKYLKAKKEFFNGSRVDSDDTR
jgi:hypothetical protein